MLRIPHIPRLTAKVAATSAVVMAGVGFALPSSTTVALTAALPAAERTSVSATTGLFPESAPAAKVDSDTDAVEVGVRFQPRTAGVVSGAQVFKAVNGASYTPSTASLWDASGKLLSSAKIAQKAGTGWVSVDFGKPVEVKADATYTVSVFAPKGRYAVTEKGFTSQVTNATLRSAAGSNGVYNYGSRSAFPTQSYAQSNYWVDVAFVAGNGEAVPPTTPVPSKPVPTTPVPTKPVPTTPVPTTPVPTTPVPTTPVPTTPVPTTPPPTTPPVTPNPTGGFPDATNTGVPAGTALTNFSGSQTITTAGTVIDAKRITGSLVIRAKNVTVTRSEITGNVVVDQSGSLTITDSTIAAGNRPGTGLEAYNFVATRLHVTGGNRSMYCANNCTIRDSYVHGQFRDATGFYHESGIRMEQNTTLIHNTLACDAPLVPPDAGCSAPLTGYGDFAPVRDNLIQNNLFLPSTGSACAYGGSSKGKPYSSQAANIRFIDNVFSRGSNGKCGVYFPATDFDKSAPGNVWSGNVWDNGGTVQP